MASNTTILHRRDRLKKKKAGRKRKARLTRDGTTPPKAAFFGEKSEST